MKLILHLHPLMTVTRLHQLERILSDDFMHDVVDTRLEGDETDPT